jgi:hypothetical protein
VDGTVGRRWWRLKGGAGSQLHLEEERPLLAGESEVY